jgi:hypothetical protein
VEFVGGFERDCTLYGVLELAHVPGHSYPHKESSEAEFTRKMLLPGSAGVFFRK